MYRATPQLELDHPCLSYHGGENDYMTGSFILTFNFGTNNQDPAKDPRIPGKGHNDFPV